jgi:fermentation-respiration switch protein FrsA (DUF1100 family)
MIQGTWDLHAAGEGALLLKKAAQEKGLNHIKVHIVPGMGPLLRHTEGSGL